MEKIMPPCQLTNHYLKSYTGLQMDVAKWSYTYGAYSLIQTYIN